MKTITTIMIALLITGCATLFPPKFDSNQFYLFTQIKVTAERMVGICNDRDFAFSYLNRLDILTDELVTFAKYLPDNAEVYEITVILNEDIDEIGKRYVDALKPEVSEVSEAYCNAKMNLFVKKVDRAMQAIGQTQ